MTRLMMTLKMALIAGAGVTTLMLLMPAAEAAQCHSGKDKHGKAVMICGSVSYYAVAATTSDDEADDEDDADDDDGSLIVDVEDCEPGKFWIMEHDDEDWDTPMPCR
jgi:hypothetical protein